MHDGLSTGKGLAGRLLRRVVRSRSVRRWLLGAANAVVAAVDDGARAYHPVDAIGVSVDDSTRDRIESRWEAIAPVLRRVGARSVVDIGAAEGYYALRIAQMGIPVVALEAKERPSRILARAHARVGPPGQLIQTRMTVSPETVALLPSVDAVLLLAVWHHWVRAYGLQVADGMLRATWDRTQHVLFFETGENMPSEYGLPELGDDPRATLEARLRRECLGSKVEFLGRHPERHLFAVIRE